MTTKGKILAITYYWPPAGGPGVQRITKLIPHLHRMGWELHILTVNNPEAPVFDNSLLKGIPEKIRVHKTKSFNPYNFFKRISGIRTNQQISNNIIQDVNKASLINRLSSWIRANIFIPDARVGWLPYLIREGKRIIKEEQPDLIFSTSPPHSLQIGSRKLAKWSGLPWIADYRDPWTQGYWIKELPYTKLAKTINAKMERRAISSADVLTSVSDGILNILSPSFDKSRYCIHNGFEHYADSPQKTDTFIIRYYGNLRKTQPPENLFKACMLLEKEQRQNILIEFTGKLFPGAERIFSEYPELNIIQSGFLTYEQMMESSRSVAILFKPNTQFAYDKHSVGAKLYDYLAMRKPILALGDPEGETARIIRETQSGIILPYDDLGGIKEFITSVYKRWSEGAGVIGQSTKADEYRTKKSAEKLDKIFTERLIQG